HPADSTRGDIPPPQGCAASIVQPPRQLARLRLADREAVGFCWGKSGSSDQTKMRTGALRKRNRDLPHIAHLLFTKTKTVRPACAAHGLKRVLLHDRRTVGR